MKPPLACFAACLLMALTLRADAAFSLEILTPPDPSPTEQLAARELRRYLYLRTGQRLEIHSGTLVPIAGAIVVAGNRRPLARSLLATPANQDALAQLASQQLWLKTVRPGARPILLVTGGDDAGILYAAYRFAEHCGVRFYLHGDVVPDGHIPLRLPVLDEQCVPLFALRGIQPFHDFPEGPDWWNTDNYQAIIGQLPKLRMNFFALHTYPEGGPHAEPTVWIGLPKDADSTGQVRSSYPASYNNTLRNRAIAYNWGYAAKATGDYAYGAANLFEADHFGPDVMRGFLPQPEQPADCNTLFDRTGAMLRTAFTLAHQLGVRTCVGTETPLTIPKALQERLRAAGQDPTDPAVVEELYRGMFCRAAAAYPLDYYWFWTPEGWTWDGTKPEQVDRTMNDLATALRAHARVAPPFQLATCGWVLGPQRDRALFDKVLPKSVAVSCINREVGRTPVERGFREVRGRGKWAIPWLEDDPALTSLQLWVGRMRRDAADARRYGCDGLMGIHWRTRALSPNVAALAQAAWTQDSWNRTPFEDPQPVRTDGAMGGSVAAFPDHVIASTDTPAIYQTVRYNLAGYHLRVPNGSYRVTLKFCEPHYQAAGRRVFQVHLQGQPVIDRLDIWARVGQNRALDFSYPDVGVRNGWLDLEFLPIVEFPAIAGIVVEGGGFTRKVNCGGPAWRDFEADQPGDANADSLPPLADFYHDWATHEFGPAVGAAAAAVFARIDGRLPRPSDWTDGPGGIRPDPRPWGSVAKDYRFVDDLEALAPQVQGPGNQDRFAYWLETVRYHRAIAQVACAWGEFDRALARTQSAVDPEARRRSAHEDGLVARRELVKRVGELYDHLLATVSTTGELGTVMNWDQHNLPAVLTKPGLELEQLLGEPLPADAQPGRTYHGPTRIIVPALRTAVTAGESVRLKVIVLAEQPVAELWLRWRRFGRDGFAPVPAQHAARGVYFVDLPPGATNDDFEYFLEVSERGGTKVRFPATAPDLNQSVVVMAAK